MNSQMHKLVLPTLDTFNLNSHYHFLIFFNAVMFFWLIGPSSCSMCWSCEILRHIFWYYINVYSIHLLYILFCIDFCLGISHSCHVMFLLKKEFDKTSSGWLHILEKWMFVFGLDILGIYCFGIFICNYILLQRDC